MNAWLVVGITVGISLVLSYRVWRFIEKPAQRLLKPRLTASLQGLRELSAKVSESPPKKDQTPQKGYIHTVSVPELVGREAAGRSRLEGEAEEVTGAARGGDGARAVRRSGAVRGRSGRRSRRLPSAETANRARAVTGGPGSRTGAVRARRDGAQRDRGQRTRMTVRRVMGIETEYGISVPGQPGANAMVTSSQVVNAYLAASAARARRARWDFEEENPLRDARGFDLAREVADPSQLTDEDLGLANVILTNGARLYVDHAHPEYSTPECTNPRAAVIWDKAGERVMYDAAHARLGPAGQRADPALQEQHRQQGRLVRLPRELPDAARHPVRRHRPAPDPVLRLPPGGRAARAGSASARTRAARASRSASAPTSSRSRSAWRPRSSGRSSTPGTSRTPTRRSTAACT